MKLERLTGQGFRNLQPFDVPTDARFVVLHGPNAQGKTNFLEAVHWLATLKPLRSRRAKELVQWGGEDSVVTGVVRAQGVPRTYRVQIGAQGRTVHLDGKSPSDLAEYFHGVRAITFQPQDGRIVAGEPARRRAWVDRAAFTASPAHLEVVRTYKRVLDQKSALLKGDRPDRALLDTLDVQVATVGAQLAARRAALLDDLLPHVRSLHADLASDGREVGLNYLTEASGSGIEERRNQLLQRLTAARSQELRRRMCLVGPQGDDVDVTLGGRSARAYGSRGQVRSLVLVLKLAELVAARDRDADVPIFLLDDVSSELDRSRTRRLVSLLDELGTQVIATTTDPEHMDPLPPAETLRIGVQAGSLDIGR